MIIKFVRRLSCAVFAYLFLAWVLYHKLYIGKSETLRTEIEQQILSDYSSERYQHLTYHDTYDRFIFCNKVTYARNDTEGLVSQAVKQMNQTEAQASNKTNDELISELKFLPCEFGRDELFSIVVIRDSETARELQAMNQAGHLSGEIL
mmetsp:Transcript_2405/g.3054  ORF Transcript_2405/g.3054 Transcript_2405/m.3054 type:complete len:149 (-) Transcript_2405:1433-1879(-)